MCAARQLSAALVLLSLCAGVGAFRKKHNSNDVSVQDREKFEAEENYEAIVKNFDHDKDGKLSRAEVDAVLDEYDRNGNGYLDTDELASSLVQYNASEDSQASRRRAQGPLRIRLNLDNGHADQRTSDQVCVQAECPRTSDGRTPVSENFCGSPRHDNWWRPTDEYVPMGQDCFFRIRIHGSDAMLIDQVIIETCWAGFQTATGSCIWPPSTEDVGGDNNVGWCLSEDADDHTGFGDRAYQSKCCNSLKVKTDHTATLQTGGAGCWSSGRCWDWTDC